MESTSVCVKYVADISENRRFEHHYVAKRQHHIFSKNLSLLGFIVMPIYLFYAIFSVAFIWKIIYNHG